MGISVYHSLVNTKNIRDVLVILSHYCLRWTLWHKYSIDQEMWKEQQNTYTAGVFARIRTATILHDMPPTSSSGYKPNTTCPFSPRLTAASSPCHARPHTSQGGEGRGMFVGEFVRGRVQTDALLLTNFSRRQMYELLPVREVSLCPDAWDRKRTHDVWLPQTASRDAISLSLTHARTHAHTLTRQK